MLFFRLKSSRPAKVLEEQESDEGEDEEEDLSPEEKGKKNIYKENLKISANLNLIKRCTSIVL